MRVLVVEDETAIRMMVTSVLRKVGYEVAEARDGGEALQLLQAGLTIDTLLTDIRMPGADGWTVARAYRERFPALPVLYVTGQSDDVLPVPGGVLIRKPFRMSQILTVLQSFTQCDSLKWHNMAGAA
jgi:CheY-like chemotaxis protein